MLTMEDTEVAAGLRGLEKASDDGGGGCGGIFCMKVAMVTYHSHVG
jgi:hypothetical protein